MTWTRTRAGDYTVTIAAGTDFATSADVWRGSRRFGWHWAVRRAHAVDVAHGTATTMTEARAAAEVAIARGPDRVA